MFLVSCVVIVRYKNILNMLERSGGMLLFT